MKYIHAPTVEDVRNLIDLSKNTRVNSYPELGLNLRDIFTSYIKYRTAKGSIASPQFPTPLSLPGSLKKAMKVHYSKPVDSVAGLKFLDELRQTGSPDICPMCGSFGTSTLDHIFPKNSYPEFSIFSKNLVPSCTCNSKRREDTQGSAPGERVLHPYFDQCLTQRLVRATITRSEEFGYDKPKIDLTLTIDPNNQIYPAVKFHVETVVKRTQILSFFDTRWVKIVRRPWIFFNTPRTSIEYSEFEGFVTESLLKSDETYETPNNWESMLFAGILASRSAMEFVYQRTQSDQS